MSKFIFISSVVLTEDENFAEYLCKSKIKSAKKGGSFIGNYEVAPDEFRGYGIILPKGGMIIPDIEPEELEEIIKKKEERRQGEIQKKEEEEVAARKAAKDAYLAEFQKLCEQYLVLGLRLKESYGGRKVVVCGDRSVFKVEEHKIGEFREALQMEIAIRDFRAQNIERVREIQLRLTTARAGSIAARSWKGSEISLSFEDLRSSLPYSHHIYFDDGYVARWTEEEIRTLERRVEKRILGITSAHEEALSRLRQILEGKNLSQIVIRRDDSSYHDLDILREEANKLLSSKEVFIEQKYNHEEGGFVHTLTHLRVGEERILFPGVHFLREAVLSLEKRGGYFEHHWVLAQWRDRAKSREWDERHSSLALRVLKGKKIEERDYDFSYTRGANDSGGAGKRATGYSRGLFLGDTRLSEEEVKFVRLLT